MDFHFLNFSHNLNRILLLTDSARVIIMLGLTAMNQCNCALEYNQPDYEALGLVRKGVGQNTILRAVETPYPIVNFILSIAQGGHSA